MSTQQSTIHRSSGTADASRSVRVTGEIDLSTVDSFRSLMSIAQESGSADLTVDLRDVTFIDSTGISALVAAALRAGERGGVVTVLAADPWMRKVFRLMQLGEVLRFDPPLSASAP